MLTESELLFLQFVLDNKGDIDLAKQDYGNAMRAKLIESAGGKPDTDMYAIIDDTVARKVKLALPAIGTAFIKQGRALGGKIRETNSTNNKETA